MNIMNLSCFYKSIFSINTVYRCSHVYSNQNIIKARYTHYNYTINIIFNDSIITQIL